MFNRLNTEKCQRKYLKESRKIQYVAADVEKKNYENTSSCSLN